MDVSEAGGTLPAWCTATGESLIVRRVVTDAIVLTWIGGAGGQHSLTIPAYGVEGKYKPVTVVTLPVAQ